MKRIGEPYVPDMINPCGEIPLGEIEKCVIEHPETTAAKELLISCGWKPDGEYWGHGSYGGGHTLLGAFMIEFKDLRERVMAMEANAKMPKVVNEIRGRQPVPIKHGVSVEVVKGNQ